MTEPNWENRIVGQGEEDPEQLAANPRNWRIHPKVQQEALTGVLDKVGWVASVIVNKQTGFVVDGHLRVSLALRRGERNIPVQYIDVTEAEEMLVLATLDPIGAMAQTDTENLHALLIQMKGDDEKIDRLLDQVAQFEDIRLDEPPEAHRHLDKDWDKSALLSVAQEAADAIETAITQEDGLDAETGEAVLLKLGALGIHPTSGEWRARTNIAGTHAQATE